MKRRPLPRHTAEDDMIVVDLRGFVHLLRCHTRLLLAVFLLCTGTAFYQLLKAPVLYTSTMVLMPVEQTAVRPDENMSRLTTAIGLNLAGETANPNFERYLNLIGSVAMAEKLQERHNYLREIFAGVWDKDTKGWKKPAAGGFFNWLGRKSNRLMGLPDWTPPSTLTLARYLKSGITVKSDKKMQFYTISFEHPDPVFAERLLRDVHATLEGMMKAQERSDLEKKIQYLTGRLRGISLVEHRASMAILLTSLERNLLLIADDLPYAAKVIDDVYVDPIPSQPQPRRTMIIAGIAGMVLGILAVLLKASWGSRRNDYYAPRIYGHKQDTHQDYGQAHVR